MDTAELDVDEAVVEATSRRDDVVERTEEMLRLTTCRDLFSSDEIMDYLLDVRSLLAEEMETPV